jgi:hypothetical protein
LAAQSKNSNIVDILIDAGADLNKQVPEGETTALHIAAINKTRQICVLLVRAGANVHLRDKKGESALDYIMTLMPDMKEQMKGYFVNGLTTCCDVKLHVLLVFIFVCLCLTC